MTRTPRPSGRRTRVALSGTLSSTVALALILAGCSSSNSGSSSESGQSGDSGKSVAAAGSTAAVAGKVFVVPQQQGGTPPYTFSEGGAPIGILPDLAIAEGKAMGSATKNEQTSFEASLLGLKRGIYAWVPGADVTAERLKSFDFATTLRDSYTLKVPVAGPTIGSSISDLCGHTLGVVTGSSPVSFLQDQSKTCRQSGKKPIVVKTFTDYATASLAAKGNRVDAAVVSTSTLGYENKKNPGVWKQTGPKFNFVDIGDATPKGNGTAQRLAASINKLIADGTYAKILAKYGASDLAIKKSVVNPTPKG